MDRVEINGVWYIREDLQPTQPEDSIKLDPVHTETLTFETNECVFEVDRMYRDDDETFYDGLTVKFTDKRHSDRTEWTEDTWDNDKFLIGVLKNDIESIESAQESLSKQGISELKCVIRYLIDRGWLTL